MKKEGVDVGISDLLIDYNFLKSKQSYNMNGKHFT